MRITLTAEPTVSLSDVPELKMEIRVELTPEEAALKPLFPNIETRIEQRQYKDGEIQTRKMIIVACSVPNGDKTRTHRHRIPASVTEEELRQLAERIQSEYTQALIKAAEMPAPPIKIDLSGYSPNLDTEELEQRCLINKMTQ